MFGHFFRPRVLKGPFLYWRSLNITRKAKVKSQSLLLPSYFVSHILNTNGCSSSNKKLQAFCFRFRLAKNAFTGPSLENILFDRKWGVRKLIPLEDQQLFSLMTCMGLLHGSIREKLGSDHFFWQEVGRCCGLSVCDALDRAVKVRVLAACTVTVLYSEE